MFERLRPALVITRREVRDQFRDWRIIIPIIVLTLIFPAIMNFTARKAVDFVEQYGANIVGERLIPFLLMVVGFFPISVSMVIALESFVGEKERRSIEPLLISPLEDWQLYLGKLLAVMVPPLVASYLGIGVYLFGVYRQIGWVAAPSLLAQILLLTLVQALVMVSGAVVISSQTTSVRAANLLASFIIIPMAFLIQGESLVMFWGRYQVLWWTIVGLVILAGLLLRTGVSHFNREELLGREMDTLDLSGSAKRFFSAFRGQSRSLWSWYRDEVIVTLRSLVLPMGFMALMLGVGMWIGVDLAGKFRIPSELIDLKTLGIESFSGVPGISLLSPNGVLVVWYHNLRVMVLALVLGVFSFGVLGIIVLMLPLIIVGYLMGNVVSMGITPLEFFAGFILPHGILEIPAIIIGGAAIWKLGGRLIAPSHGKTIGESLLLSLAEWTKILIGLVIPLLLVAAVLEVFLTPQMVLLILNHY